MKRFYCTVCKRIKRVRKYPANVVTPNAETVTNRVGSCTYHHLTARERFISAHSFGETVINRKVGV